jgi:hypothetical protein
MKYAIIIPDGAADEPQAELGGVARHCRRLVNRISIGWRRWGD